jgi:hypothetical protein
MAILPCLLALQAVVGQSARAATVPVVTGVSPDTGPAIGTTPVTITGSGFTGATEVDFGPVPFFGLIQADSFTVVSDTEITATFGQNGDFAGTTDVTVTTPDGTSATSAADQITFVLPPVVTSISPDNGPLAGGNTVTLTGTNFTGATIVSFAKTLGNGVVEAPSFTVDSDTQITAVVPASPGGGGVFAFVEVATPYGDNSNSIPPTYEWNPLPVVKSVSRVSGVNLGGEQVTLTGTGFTGASAVSFGTVPAASFTVNSDTSITATAPAQSSGLVDITVTTPEGTSVDSIFDQFTYTDPPIITGVSPAVGRTAGQQRDAECDPRQRHYQLTCRHLPCPMLPLRTTVTCCQVHRRAVALRWRTHGDGVEELQRGEPAWQQPSWWSRTNGNCETSSARTSSGPGSPCCRPVPGPRR